MSFIINPYILFSPTKIVDLTTWYDPSDTATIHATTGLVDTIDDKISGYNATSSGINRPTTGVATINGLNALSFDGTSDRLTLPSGLYTVPAGPNTVFVVFKTASATTDQRLLTGVVSAGTRWGILYYQGGAEIRVVNNTSFTPQGKAITGDTNAHVAHLSRSGTALAVGWDGVEASGTNGLDVTVTTLYIGTNPGANGQFLNGALGEVLIYSRALSTAEKNQIGAYLAAKWAVTWAGL